MKDRRGADIHVGDICVHASSGRYGAYDVVRVEGFTAKRVNVDAIDYMRVGWKQDFSPQGTRATYDPHNLIVVTLPHVENRLN